MKSKKNLVVLMLLFFGLILFSCDPQSDDDLTEVVAIDNQDPNPPINDPND